MSRYLLTEPCNACPFVRGSGFTFARLAQFADHGEFACHKTCDHDEDEGTYHAKSNGKSMVCAGMLIFNEKRGTPNQMMRIAGRIRLYDPRKLNMEADVGSTPSDYRKPSRAERGWST